MAYGTADFSRDAVGIMGPPKFEDAAVPVGQADEHITIKLR